VSFSLTACTLCELPNAAATASSLLPQSNVLQATGVKRAYTSRSLMCSWLLVCAGMECHKDVKTFVLYQVEGSEVCTIWPKRALRLRAATLSLNLVQTRRTLLCSKQKVFDFCGDMSYWMISPFTTCTLLVNIPLTTFFVDLPGAPEPDGILYLH
jgi:hypothetical protein